METAFDLNQYFSPEGYTTLLRAMALLLIGGPIIFGISRWVRIWANKAL